jgi:hypothetical protein
LLALELSVVTLTGMFGYAFSKAWTAGILGGSTQSTRGLAFETESIDFICTFGVLCRAVVASAGALTPTNKTPAAIAPSANAFGRRLLAGRLIPGCFVLKFMGALLLSQLCRVLPAVRDVNAPAIEAQANVISHICPGLSLFSRF